MPRTTKQLTATEIKNAKPKAKAYKLADGGGLSLRIRPNGTKDWILRYKEPFTKLTKEMSFSTYPAVSLSDAREKREEAKRLLANDIDPKVHKAEIVQAKLEEKANTFEQIAEEWMNVKKSKITERYATQVQSSLENHLFPHIGSIPVSAITPAKVIEVLKPIEAKGSAETVRRLCQRINEVMEHAVIVGKLNINPLGKIYNAFIAPPEKHLPTIKPEELPEFLKRLQQASIKRVTKALIEWQLHTMVRPSEAARAEWQEIDLEKQIWSIPPEKMKKKSNGVHIVPLTSQTTNILTLMKAISGNGQFIFPSDRDNSKHVNSQTANMAIKRMGYKGELVSHGLRALASTTLNEQAFDPDVIEACLAHVDKNAVRRAYNRSDYLERRRKVMQWWSNHIESCFTGSFSLGSCDNLTDIKRVI
ncbi:MAG: tyrosine-type recombinase/integrase [Alteromonadaceae bacterium]|nr:tyrosine-type recombinase/integrase [Alteromonadaceae bacterium]